MVECTPKKGSKVIRSSGEYRPSIKVKQSSGRLQYLQSHSIVQRDLPLNLWNRMFHCGVTMTWQAKITRAESSSPPFKIARKNGSAHRSQPVLQVQRDPCEYRFLSIPQEQVVCGACITGQSFTTKDCSLFSDLLHLAQRYL